MIMVTYEHQTAANLMKRTKEKQLPLYFCNCMKSLRENLIYFLIIIFVSRNRCRDVSSNIRYYQRVGMFFRVL
jgi:hypothetical protein